MNKLTFKSDKIVGRPEVTYVRDENDTLRYFFCYGQYSGEWILKICDPYADLETEYFETLGELLTYINDKEVNA